jgi:hypothetical protein
LIPGVTNWSELRDAYGPATEVPDLLAAASADDGRGVWDDLWSRLCHQGTVYSASYAALPVLAELAARRAPAGYAEPLHLAAAIVGADDGAEPFAEISRRYAAELSALRDLAEQSLPLAEGPVEFVYALQGLLAFEGVPNSQYQLEALADEELELSCPQCHEQFSLSLAAPPKSIIPATPDALDAGAAARMYELAVRHDRPDVATGILYLLGETTCPSCAHNLAVPDALA